ncbi:unnamed protein product [Penicillium egyptiacum]|uniref:Uncharacterized protein n=1 Tax=Penicillium egyptiacum TaxID=1303716 RepID=A0A9W4KG53_9EURO|nr:unnamed protein product [Penicillium egyptiacum]
MAQIYWPNTAFSGPWEKNIYAPASRTVRPASTLSELKANAVTDSSHPYKAALHGNGSIIVFVFGIEVGGIVHLDYTSTGSGALGLAFTEAKNWIGEQSDSSSALYHDGALYANISSTGKGAYVMPDEYLRATWSNLRAYQGYFHCSDKLLNRIWYSSAYTLQTNEVPVDTGRVTKGVTSGWLNNGTLGPGDTIIVDGAKRDREVWPGDKGIAVPSAFVSLGDLESVKNALQIMYNTQLRRLQNKTTGAFDESGPPLSQKDSDTYHMWSMIGTYKYVLHTNDTDFLLENWASYKHAMGDIYGKVTYSSGLLNVTGTRDWARWQQGYNNSEAQMNYEHLFLCRLETQPIYTADGAPRPPISRKQSTPTYCWDESYGAFKDNATNTSLHPQDANSMAIMFGVVNEERTASISEKLLKNWTPIGAVAPELRENIALFISSFEIQSHFIAHEPARALYLIRRGWGWYINTRMVQRAP